MADTQENWYWKINLSSSTSGIIFADQTVGHIVLLLVGGGKWQHLKGEWCLKYSRYLCSTTPLSVDCVCQLTPKHAACSVWRVTRLRSCLLPTPQRGHVLAFSLFSVTANWQCYPQFTHAEWAALSFHSIQSVHSHSLCLVPSPACHQWRLIIFLLWVCSLWGTLQKCVNLCK